VLKLYFASIISVRHHLKEKVKDPDSGGPKQADPDPQHRLVAYDSLHHSKQPSVSVQKSQILAPCDPKQC
jgi:hypothetical protein